MEENEAESKQKTLILIIDDDEIHLEMVGTVLTENNYNVATAKSCKEALGLFYKGLIPHLILLDIIMPEMDGWSTYNRIRAMSGLYNTPIAFFSASNDPKDSERAREMGAVDYIKKPYELGDFLSRIEKFVRK